MKDPSKGELIISLKLIKKQCDEMIELVEQIVPEKEWYTTAEAADIAGIKPKTATNYAASGVWQKTKKEGRSWLIHKSELV